MKLGFLNKIEIYDRMEEKGRAYARQPGIHP